MGEVAHLQPLEEEYRRKHQDLFGVGPNSRPSEIVGAALIKLTPAVVLGRFRSPICDSRKHLVPIGITTTPTELRTYRSRAGETVPPIPDLTWATQLTTGSQRWRYWPQILALYDHLLALAPNHMALLSRVVAVAQVRGPQSALVELDAVADLPGLAGHYRVDAVRAHLAEQAGDPEAAASSPAGRPALAEPTRATPPAPPRAVACVTPASRAFLPRPLRPAQCRRNNQD